MRSAYKDDLVVQAGMARVQVRRLVQVRRPPGRHGAVQVRRPPGRHGAVQVRRPPSRHGAYWCAGLQAGRTTPRARQSPPRSPPRRRPRPVLRPVAQSRSDRIPPDVVPDCIQLRCGPHVAVEVLPHPERSAAAKDDVCAARRCIPSTTAGSCAAARPATCSISTCTMVRHDAPLEQPVARAIEQEQRILNEPGDLGSSQMARSPTGILVHGDPLVHFRSGAALQGGTPPVDQRRRHAIARRKVMF